MDARLFWADGKVFKILEAEEIDVEGLRALVTQADALAAANNPQPPAEQPAAEQPAPPAAPQVQPVDPNVQPQAQSVPPEAPAAPIVQ